MKYKIPLIRWEEKYRIGYVVVEGKNKKQALKRFWYQMSEEDEWTDLKKKMKFNKKTVYPDKEIPDIQYDKNREVTKA